MRSMKLSVPKGSGPQVRSVQNEGLRVVRAVCFGGLGNERTRVVTSVLSDVFGSLSGNCLQQAFSGSGTFLSLSLSGPHALYRFTA